MTHNCVFSSFFSNNALKKKKKTPAFLFTLRHLRRRIAEADGEGGPGSRRNHGLDVEMLQFMPPPREDLEAAEESEFGRRRSVRED